MRLITLGILTVGLTISVSAGPFTSASDLCQNNLCGAVGGSFTGPTTGSGDLSGASADGGNDAFDDYGYYNSGLGGLTVTRQVDRLGSNVYRWVDTFTNAGTGSTINQAVNFFGNLGSDTNTATFSSSQFVIVTFQDAGGGVPSCCDPVVGAVLGNNAFAAANIARTLTVDSYNLLINLSVANNTSVSVAYFAILALTDDGQPATAGDLAAALAAANALRDSPDFSGLSQGTINNIVNFNSASVPEPGTMLLTGIGVAVLGLIRRRKRA